MTQEEKQLLLKDLCPRLPYFVEAQVVNTIEGESKPLAINKELTFSDVESFANNGVVCNIKSYLRPLSSMTEEEKKEYNKTRDRIAVQWDDYGNPIGFEFVITFRTIDYLLQHHFDFRGLIKKGLALEAPKGMYKQ